MKTLPIELTEQEAQQLYHGIEFARNNLRDSKTMFVPVIMTEQEYLELAERLKALQDKMAEFGNSFPVVETCDHKHGQYL